MTDAEVYKRPATWRIVLAALLDFITAFGIGYILASIFGGKTETGFNLQGGPALLFLILLVAYFLVFNKYLGGTIWKRFAPSADRPTGTPGSAGITEAVRGRLFRQVAGPLSTSCGRR